MGRRSKWAARAWQMIDKVDSGLPSDATMKDRKAALHEVAFSFHGGTSWGQRVWGRECRKYYERHGQKPRAPRSPKELNLPADISFPFYGENRDG